MPHDERSVENARRFFLPRRAFIALCFGLALAGSSGCNRDAALKLVPVTGRVTFNGQPLTRGSVSFRPDAEQGNTSSHEPAGDIDADGNYKLYTAGKAGAPPGWYRVGVVSTAEADPANPSAVPKSFIPRKFGKAEDSGLKIQVVENPPATAYDLTLKP